MYKLNVYKQTAVGVDLRGACIEKKSISLLLLNRELSLHIFNNENLSWGFIISEPLSLSDTELKK